MSRPAPVRIPSVFTRFTKLLNLRERITGLFRSRHSQPAPAAKLHVETMEERVVPDGRPLPGPVIFTGSGVGDAPLVNAYSADTGDLRWSTQVYGPSFTGGVHVAAGDFNGDGVPDAVVAPGAGHSPKIKIFDGKSGAQLSGPLGSFLAYDSSVTSGVYVAAADVDGDHHLDIITAAETDHGPKVKVFSGVDGSVIASFVVSGNSFDSGITVAAADFTGDGKAEVVVGAGVNGRVKVYDPLTGTIISGPLGSFRAFGSDYTGSVFVGTDSLAGDVNGDGVPDLAVSKGTGTARVKVFSGATGEVLYNFQPFGSDSEGGARVALAYVDDDAHADIVVGSGTGDTDRVRVFSGATGAQLAAPVGQYRPFGDATGGVSVSASNDPLAPVFTWDSGPTSWTVGQVVRLVLKVSGQQFPTPIQPTGTVILTGGVLGGPTYTLGTESLVADGTGYQATATFDLGSLPAGTFSLTATYSGDSNYGGGTQFRFVTVSAPSSSVPADVAPGTSSCICAGPIANPGGLGEATRGNTSASGVNYGTGTVSVVRSDLSSSGLGTAFGQTWDWTNASGYSDGTSGSGATATQVPHLVQVNGDDSLAVVANASTAYFFDLYGSAYHERFGGTATLTHDTGAGTFTLTDGTGQSFTFSDFSTSTPTGRSGKLSSMSDPAGNVTSVTSWDTSGRPTEVQRTTGSGSSALTESFVYTYISGGVNDGLLDTVTQRTQVDTGSWTTVRTTAYTYYDGTTGPGLAGELRTAVVKDASGNTIDTSYYRYYTSGTGSTGNLQYAFGAAAFDRLTAALGTSLDSLTDAQVDDYADTYLQYDSNGLVTSTTNAGEGCSVCSGGQGTFSYTYTNNTSTGLLDYNAWQTKTVETLPDGTTNTVYTNAFGQVMLKVYTDASSNQWITYNKYDDQGRLILTANPSAVTGYDDTYNDLVHFVSGNASYLSDSSGLITVYTYADTTTATTSTAGDAAGYLKEVNIQQGETGTAVPQQTLTYIANRVSGVDYFHIASQTQYRNDNGTGGQTTSYSYTFQSGTNEIASETTTLPTVTTAENGSNSANTTETVFDSFGRPVWTKDESGSINYTKYDDLTGAVVKTIQDVDTTQTTTFTNLPSGWSTPSGGGLHLTTTYEADGLGRVTKTTYPNGRVDYTVYDDANLEVRTYSGWNTSTNRPTGPATVTRTDRDGGYTETLTMSAAPAVSSGVPTGTESIANVQSLSRSYTNAAGQVIYTDDYFNLSGLSYSTSTSLGTEGVNFYRTRYQYDDLGRLTRTVSPEGTITRTVYNGQGRAVSEWVGTDDTPTSGYWSPTNLTGTNMVKVREYEYDGGGVGDGNLTKVTEYPGGSAADRVTQTWYDWRDRAVAVKQGVETTESTDVNRPLVVTTYDNLGEVTETQLYDGDGVTPSISSGVLSLPSGTDADLRAQSTTSYDELGRAYRTDTYSVDPSSGSVGTDTLYSETWYDARGQVIKTLSPGGLVQKNVYDGAGRVTVSYTTDGGGDSGYSDAADVSGDIVLEQVEYGYDESGNVLTVTTRERDHDASGTGTIGSPSGIAARVSFMGYYYDLADRQTATVNVGTNGGSSWTRPSSVPSSSSTVLVTSTSYTTDAVQDVTLTGSPTGGTFTLSFGGYTTGNIAYNASASTVQSALEGLTSIGSGNVAVTDGLDGSGWEVRFAGTLADSFQVAITGDGTNLTGGTTPAVAVATVNAGGDVGMAAEVTDPAGHVTRTYADAMGRTVRTIEDFTDGVVTDGSNKTVGYTYNGAGMTGLTAYLTGGGGQTTAYVFGVSQGSGSEIDSNDVVGITQWPDPTTGAASSGQQETTTVNALGQTLTATDRNGNVHTLSYDVLGRVVSDAVTTLGSGVDGSVRRIETAYDGQGNPYLVTSYDAASGGSIVNQVERAFNGLGQMTTEWQEHSGAVNTSTSTKVQYGYSEMPSGADHSRLTSITYPDGYVLTYNYSSGLNDSISRLSSLSDSTGTLEAYSYMGLATVVVRSHPQIDVDLTFVGTPGDAGDQYAGLDRFGRVVDQLWENTSTSTATDEFQYAYDVLSNRTSMTNGVNSAFDESYTYDDLNQLTGFSRGSHTQDFNYDAVGNFDSVTTDGGTAQTRSANAQNEITSISGATTPTYDANGNMTGDETGRQFVYDAWNRLVVVKNSGGTTLETFGYDGLNQRVSTTASGTTTDLYYSSQQQVLEEEVGGSATARYVWSPVYVNAMVLRDRVTTTPGTLDERLWVQQDTNWNITALVNDSGVVVERDVYDPYGVQSVLNASWSSLSGSAYSMTYGFQGMYFNSIAGMNAADERWYTPTLEKWTGPDPERFGAGDVNLYGFVGENPVNRFDPSGLEAPLPGPPKPVPVMPQGPAPVRPVPLGRLPGSGAGPIIVGQQLGELLKPTGDRLGEWLGNKLYPQHLPSTLPQPLPYREPPAECPKLPRQKSAREQDCDDQYDADCEVCRRLKSRLARAKCWASAAERKADCLAGRTPRKLITDESVAT